jgi:uncharacterized membrane protein YcfT
VAGAHRVQWVDVAKGVAIVLVAVHHSVLFLAARNWLPEAVPRLNDYLGTFRMPLFFLASGLFAAGTLRSSWSVVMRKRVLFFIWLYVVWLVLRFGFFAVVPNPTLPGEGRHPLDLLVGLVVPSTGLWFIYALALFSIAAKALWRVPVVMQLIGAAVLAALAGGRVIPIQDFAWRYMAMYLVFFLAGCHLAGAVRTAAAAVTPSRAVPVVLGWLLVLAGAVKNDLLGVPGVLLAVSVLAVAAGVAISALLADRMVGGPLRRLGQRTIDVYLPHVLLIGGMTWLIAETGVEVPAAAGALLVPVVAFGAVLLSLLVSAGLRRAGATWLFSLPGRLAHRRALSGVADRS